MMYAIVSSTSTFREEETTLRAAIQRCEHLRYIYADTDYHVQDSVGARIFPTVILTTETYVLGGVVVRHEVYGEYPTD